MAGFARPDRQRADPQFSQDEVFKTAGPSVRGCRAWYLQQLRFRIYISATGFLPRLALPYSVPGVSLFEAAALSLEAAGLTLPLLWPDDPLLCDLLNHSLVVEAAQ